MIKAFLYPNISPKKSTNPYISDFINSLSFAIDFCNLKHPSESGIFNAYRYIGKIDILFLNWIEDLPDKRGGYLQSLGLIILIVLLKLARIKIFYTLHNKQSHYDSHKNLKTFLGVFILKKADFILCHSSEGIEVLKKWNVPLSKFQYHPHPFYTDHIIRSYQAKEYDILIWGAIRPYKGIDKYLMYLESRKLLSKYRTKIVGKIFPVTYENLLMQFKSDLIEIENTNLDNDSLNEMIDKSRIILFTYNDSSVLSSGAVIYSLGRGANIIGPDVASFHNLYEEGLIKVFKNFEELISHINYTLSHPDISTEKIEAYIEINTWSKFAKRIYKWITYN